MPFVEPPRLLHRNPQEIHFIAGDPQRANGPLQHRGVRDVELELLFGHQPAGLAGFRSSLLVQVDIGPAGEPVLLVPDAFAVTEEDKSIHAGGVRL